ncbi:hypothetical protein [Frateuria aurantia]|uniref:Bacteriophage protein n=1 Tax=Frateuria aurantia (strain ATCC 33424 / DSM 6220 / KCTC 2777 / LMG 1558 / NBRC 3245 / NCIMB 13370) TaxID=767434 RepID=H8L682_FRAAD|nr:hypothetical protein [Frateuria aurantia]AFC85926.1 hypothetical protein Fraau_1506 [Frateuria aurantia DSM 6220]
MIYRKLNAAGDYSFGAGPGDFYQNSPEAVAQAVLTRLRLLVGEWFLDTTAGTPWATQILGKGTSSVYDSVIKNRILGTTGVQSIDCYSSSVSDRKLSVTATITTAYGSTTVEASL